MENKTSITIKLPQIKKGLKLYIDAQKEIDLKIVEDHKNYHEAKHQLLEGTFYDYSFNDKDFRLICLDHKKIIQNRTRKKQKHIGTISPNIYVGTLSLQIYNVKTKDKGKLNLEVRSKKTSYRQDYQFMLNQISEKCADLILQANSPVSHTLETDYNADNKTLYQRFVFIKAMITSPNFDDAIQRIISSPTTKWQTEEELIDVRKIKRFNNKNLRQLVHGTNRILLKTTHTLYKKDIITSIATKISSSKKIESVDTNENRFIKHALETFLRFCEKINSHKNAKKRLKQESKLVIEKLDTYLQNTLFKEISRPTTLKLNSPILQKKEGYRDVLKVWLKFDLAAKLIWTGGNEVYSAGKKDIATLYEYWLFFKLLDLIKSVFKIDAKELNKLITTSPNGLNLQLKQGDFIALNGIYKEGNRNLNIRFNYNKSFKKNTNIKESGSWTTTLRPDYTLSIWESSLTETIAEQTEQIVHIHFDAKYKVANINQILGDKEVDNKQLNSEKKQNLKGIYKNADLLKMHAYKDAIRRTAGAYVLYPGEKDKTLKGFHEILPGLGAFPIKPTQNDTQIKYLENFLKEVLQHFLNRTTQRENIATKKYKIISKPIKKLNEPLPEYFNEEKIIPDEAFVLVGYYKKEQYKWITSKKMYNFRMGSGNGSLILDNETVNAKYLLLHTKKDNNSTNLWKITSKGIRVYSNENLKKTGYKKPSKPYYLVIELEKIDLSEFGNNSWEFKKLQNYKKGNASAFPFTTTIAELMNNKQ